MTLLTHENISEVDWKKAEDDLIPAIVQHVETAQVLMMGYMNQDALAKTFEIKKVTFLSRKTQSLWTKGETSGNFLKFISAELDCDKDTILIQANPVGSTCHTGDFTCFNDIQAKGNFLDTLQQIIKTRKNDDSNESYTASLFAEGLSRMCQKVGEEGVEVALAAMKKDKNELLNESADLIFHLMVLLEKNNLCIQDVVDILQKRHKN